MEEVYPGINKHIISYIIGLDSLKAISTDNNLARNCEDIRLRMDGLFEEEEIAIQFTKEFTALYTNGPAGGGGVRSFSITCTHLHLNLYKLQHVVETRLLICSTGCKKEIILEKGLVSLSVSLSLTHTHKTPLE